MRKTDKGEPTYAAKDYNVKAQKKSSKDYKKCDGAAAVFLLFFVLASLSILYLFLSRSSHLGNIVWNGKSSIIFPDFFETLWNAGARMPYEKGSIYPPFTYALMYCFSRFVPAELIIHADDVVRSGGSRFEGIALIVKSPAGQLAFIAFFVLSIALLLHFTRFGNNKVKYTYFCVMFFLSAPFLSMIERGNIVVLTVALLLGFLH